MVETKEKATIKIINFRYPVDEKEKIRVMLARDLSIPEDCIVNVSILRRSLDARQQRLDFVSTLALEFIADKEVIQRILKRQNIERYTKKEYPVPRKISPLTSAPVIVGCGPAGLFAAITLVERGVKPIVIERGERIIDRVSTVAKFWKHGKLNPESNTLFGDGGAGTISDGKLTTRIKTPLREKVLREFVNAGADSEIIYDSKPHLGTDRLRKIVPRIVDGLKKNGVQFLFNTPVTDILIKNSRITGVRAGMDHIGTDNLFMACGHSARDLYEILMDKGAALEPKSFAVGLRVEHPQEFINQKRLGSWAGNSELGAADYFFSYKDSESGRGVYTFCMCPGGFIIGCPSSSGELCVNGMSILDRNSRWGNAAVVVTVRPEDFFGESPMKGILFQKELEKKAFLLGGDRFFAPLQQTADFVGYSKKNLDENILSSYRPGTVSADLRKHLPEFITGPLSRGLRYFDQKMPGFIDEGILVGVETRTSSPLRILRNKNNFHSINISGLIPIGEGSGYTGGIISSAVDGIRAALQFDARSV